MGISLAVPFSSAIRMALIRSMRPWEKVACSKDDFAAVLRCCFSIVISKFLHSSNIRSAVHIVSSIFPVCSGNKDAAV